MKAGFNKYLTVRSLFPNNHEKHEALMSVEVDKV